MNNEEKKTVIYRIVRAVFRGIRIVFPPVDMLRIIYLARRNRNKIYKFNPISFDDYCKAIGGHLTIIEESQKRIVYEPAYYPDQKGEQHIFESGPIYIAELENVEVHGGTGLVIVGNKVLTDICANDTENRVEYASGPIRKGSKKTFYVEVANGQDEIAEAVSFCGLASDNYYHLTIEILSRYEYVREYIEDKNLTVLLDENAKKYKQFEELVKTVVGNAKVYFVPMYQRVSCKKLIYPSMNTWMPMNVRRKTDFRLSDNLIAKSGIDNIRKATEGIRKAQTGLKVFVSRKNATLSRIVNEEEVAEIFKENGFRIVCTEELTYKEQVELFSSASCIVGASGAAMTNLIYCNPKTVFGCFIPKAYEFCIYSTIAYSVGCIMLFYDAKISKSGDAISTEQWKVNVDDCNSFIRTIEKECGVQYFNEG